MDDSRQGLYPCATPHPLTRGPNLSFSPSLVDIGRLSTAELYPEPTSFFFILEVSCTAEAGPELPSSGLLSDLYFRPELPDLILVVCPATVPFFWTLYPGPKAHCLPAVVECRGRVVPQRWEVSAGPQVLVCGTRSPFQTCSHAGVQWAPVT